MRLVVIDDHAQFAERVCDTVGREPDFESVHHETPLADGLELIARTPPDPMMQRAESAKACALHAKNAGPARLLWVLRNSGPGGFTVHPGVLHQLKAGGPPSPRSDGRTVGPTQPPTFSG
jgi:hypothetical protein